MQKKETLIVSLAQLLAAKQAEPNVIRQGLSLLREGFGFAYACMYEADHYARMCLTDSSGDCPAEARREFELEAISPALTAALNDARLLYCPQQGEHTPEQAQMLALLGAKSAAVAAVTDKGGQLIGLLALCNGEEPTTHDGPTRDWMMTALALLSSYAAVRMYQNRVTFTQSALESMLDNTGIDIYVNDFETHEILYVNESMAAPYGGRAQFAGRKCWQVLFPGQNGPCEFCPQKQLIDEEGNPTKVYTWDYQRAFDGSWFRVFSAAFRWVDGRLAHVVSSADITDNKRNEALVEYMANYDALTDLPNRRMLVSECQKRIDSATEKQAYLLFFDIDGFKNINDTLGHDAGDEFLVKLGAFFSEIPMLKGSIYRNGGDEFVAVLDDGITDDHVRSLAYFIHARFEKPWRLKGGQVKCGISVGVSRYPQDGKTAEDLLYKADQAMYHVKKTGGSGISFSGEQEEHFT